MKEKKLTKAKLKELKDRTIRKVDKAWSKNIRNRDGNKCAYCGSTKNVQAAHIIPREIFYFRWDMDNGVALCSTHHRFRPKEMEDKTLFSAHFNPFAFNIWLANFRTTQFISLVNKFKEFTNGTEKV